MKNLNIELIVEKNSKLLEYLFDKIQNKSKNNIKSLLTRGCILVDGKVITKYDYELKQGQKILVKLSQIHDKAHDESLDIIYEDNDMIVINKPAGLLSIATNNEKTNTAYHMVANYFKRANRGNHIFVVHRLDKDTSGIIVFAKNEKIKHLLQENWNDIVLVRGYLAIVEGIVKNENDTIKSWLKETSTLLVYSSKREGDGDLAITHYKKVKNNNKYTLLDIRIDTGRKNQIRVHMKEMGHSIIGDKKYGAKLDPIKRMGLHAHLLEFKHPLTNKIMHFEAEIPSEFNSLF